MPDGRIYIIIAAAAAVAVVIAVILLAVFTARPKDEETESASFPAEAEETNGEEMQETAGQITEAEEAMTDTGQEEVLVLEGQPADGGLERYDNALFPLSSSVYPVSKEISYGPENVLDQDLNTAWVEDGSEGPVGEWIQLNLPMDTQITGVRIVNGYMKDEGILRRNCQIRRGTLEFSDGRSFSLTFTRQPYEENARGEIFLFPEPVYTGYVRLVIDEVYEGEAYGGKEAFSDLAVSEFAVLTEQPYDWSETAEGAVSDYILPESSTRFLSEEDLEGLSQEELRLARNEIYARYGRKFDDEGLRTYFEALPWYEGTVESGDFQESWLNEYEIYNRDLIVAYEEKMNYR